MKLIFTVALCLVGFFFNKTIAQVNVQDSLALVDLYDSTEGANWTHPWNLSNPANTWYGITVSNNRIISIYLVQQNLKGTIPPSLGNLSELQSLIMPYNQLSGAIPSSLGNLSSLQNLYLYYNQLTGEIPSSIGNLTNLKNLWLYVNKLSGIIPTSLGNLGNLQSLILGANQLTGALPSSLGNLSNLQHLEITNTQISDSIPSSLGNLGNLIFLLLSSNQLIGTIPISLGSLNSLQYFSLDHNQLTGTISSSFSNLINLKAVSLSNNYLNDSVHSFWGSLYNLTSLDLSNNRLFNSIPLALGNSKSLQQLNLDNNQLTGSIPDELGNMSNLNVVKLQNNQLSGSISDSLSKLNKLGLLDLGDNKLSGKIPASLGYLSNIIYLTLSDNFLVGSIPASFANLINLQSLDLDNNKLADTIPAAFNTLTNLTSLVLWKNNFTFSSLEKIAQSYPTAASYNPQASISLHQAENKLSVSAGGTLSNNIYHWYENGSLIANIMNDSTYTVTQTGKYYVTVINSIATQLTLYSDTLNITVLPIKLLSFTAQKQNNTTLMQWQTANEVNNNYFSIERSPDSKLFTAIGNKQATNSALTTNYSFVDNAPFNGLNYYRLKQVDKDGKSTYSNIVSVDFSNSASMFAVYPNPANNILHVTLPSINKTFDIVLYDAAGKKVMREQLASNVTLKQINISKLPAGVYNVMLVQDGKQQTISILKK